MNLRKLHLTFILSAYLTSLIAMSMGLVICADHDEDVSSEHSHAHFEVSEHHDEESHDGQDKDILDHHILSDSTLKIKKQSFELSASILFYSDSVLKDVLASSLLRFKPQRIHSPHNNILKQIRTIVIRT